MKVLFLSYNGLTEPLGRRQVMPYVVGLAQRGWQYTVISFEKRETADAEARRQVREGLAAADVCWVPLTYHRRPSLPATAYDISAGVFRGLGGLRGTALIHARSTVPAAMARALSGLARVPWIFDVRGLVAEEYADAGHWRPDSLLFRLTNGLERRLIRGADGLVFLTEAIRTVLAGEIVPADTPSAVIPCAADERVFCPSPTAREKRRAELGLREAPLLVYAGSVSGWNAFGAMIAFFTAAREEIPGLKLLVVTPQLREAEHDVRQAGVGGDVLLRSARPEAVPEYLAAADAGIGFRSGGLSKKAASPTKYGEYLATGLPVIADSWTGDSDRLRTERVWIAVDRFDREHFLRAAVMLRGLLQDPERARAEALRLAAREFGLRSALDRYEALYRTVIGHSRQGQQV